MLRTLTVSRLLLNLLFFIPFIVLYGKDIGLSFTTVLAVEGVFGVLVALLDLPCGHVADAIGPKYALAAGGVLQGGACVLLFAAPTVATFWSVQILFAVSLALSRGADSALNVSLLRKCGTETRFLESEASFMSLALAGEATAYFIGGVVSLLGYRYTFLMTGITQAIGSMLVLSLPQGQFDQRHRGVTLLERMRRVARTCRSSRDLAALLLVMVLVGTAFSTVLYLAPALAQADGITTYRLGSLFAVATLAAAVVSQVLRRQARGYPYIVALAGFCAMAFSHFALVLAGVALVKAAQSVIVPQFRRAAMVTLGQHGEATAMSVVSTATMLGLATIGPLLGTLSDRFGLRVLLVVCGSTFALGTILLRRAQTEGA